MNRADVVQYIAGLGESDRLDLYNEAEKAAFVPYTLIESVTTRVSAKEGVTLLQLVPALMAFPYWWGDGKIPRPEAIELAKALQRGEFILSEHRFTQPAHPDLAESDLVRYPLALDEAIFDTPSFIWKKGETVTSEDAPEVWVGPQPMAR